jgi:hypothetical protein
MKMKMLTLMSGAALLGIAGVTLAQDGPAPGRPGPDADITRQQVIARTDAMFARLDANRDGRVTRDEARAQGERRREEMRQHMFDRIDANHDGNINREEFAAAHERRGARGLHRRMGPGPGGPEGPGGPGGPGGRRGMHGGGMFGAEGATLEQMRARALERFDRADANRDGTLTATERQAARGRMRHAPAEMQHD